MEDATGRTAAIVGKPEPQLFLTALDRLGEGRTLVVGDRLDSDMAAGGERAELDAALVLSGGATREAARREADPPPVAVADTLGRAADRAETRPRARR